jgi:CxxC-x17-CxxC domain-containing protein
MNDITPFAQTNFRNQKRQFGIKTDDRRRHVYIIGKTGMGKTSMLENMVVSDLRAGNGVAVVDPHGEFAEKMLDFIPASRVNDVVYFNPADRDYPIAFNILEEVDAINRPLVASGVVGVFHKLWAESWGPRLEYVLRNAILGLMEYPDATLLGVMRILIDKEYRKKVVAEIKDPVVRSFWVDEYSKYPDKFQAEAVAPIQNKVGQFLTSPIIRNIVGQPHSSFNMRKLMDEKKILIMNLSKGRIGEDNSKLLGAMMITKIQLAAMSRIDMPEIERNDFYLYVDEFQNFATESFANILSEARKYRLDLILAHQYIEQLDETVRSAIFGNVGTIISFRVGAEDAELLEKEFTPEFIAEDLVNLTKYNIYLKLMIDGVASRAFSAETLPPITPTEPSQKAAIIDFSRNKYATSRVEVEKLISSGTIENIAAEIKKISENIINEDNNRRTILNETNETKKMFDARCAICGKAIQVPFKPDPRKLTYCKEHLEMIKNKPLPTGQFHQEPHPSEDRQAMPIGRQAMPTGRQARDQKFERPVQAPRAQAPAEKIKEISLQKAIKTEPQKFNTREKIIPPKIKKEINLSELRKNIENIKRPDENLREPDNKTEDKIEKNKIEEDVQTKSDNQNKGSLNPGERITFN